MKTILATTDFSNASVNAINYAAGLALAVNARLVLLHVFQVPVSPTEVPMPEPVFEEMLDDARQELDKLSKKLTQRTKGKLSISIQLEIGTVHYQINEFSKNENPFAIVMGLEAGSNFEKFLLGSKTLYAVKRLSSPVLVVPENVVFSPIKKIGLASDLEQVSVLPFEKINEWLSAFNASLDIIHVSRSGAMRPGETGESVSLRNNLTKFHPSFHFMVGENMGEKIDEFVKDHQINLLIIVPKKHGIDEMFNEKHAKKIIVSQHVPILAIHGK